MVIDDNGMIGFGYQAPEGYRVVVHRTDQCTTTTPVKFRVWIDRRYVAYLPIVDYGNDVRTFTSFSPVSRQPQTKAEKNRARLKQLRGRAGRWC